MGGFSAFAVLIVGALNSAADEAASAPLTILKVTPDMSASSPRIDASSTAGDASRESEAILGGGNSGGGKLGGPLGGRVKSRGAGVGRVAGGPDG